MSVEVTADIRPNYQPRTGPLATCFVGIGPRIRAVIKAWLEETRPETDQKSLKHYYRPVGWVIEQPLPPSNGPVKRSVDRFPEGLLSMMECCELAERMGVELYTQPIKRRRFDLPKRPWELCPEFWKYWLRISPELAWMAAFRALTPEELFGHYETVNYMWVNTHPYVAHGSWHPFTRQEFAMKGCTPYEGALETGVKNVSIFAHLIDPHFDAGNLIGESTSRPLYVIPPEKRWGGGKDQPHTKVPYNASEMKQFIWFNHAQMAEPTVELFRELAHPLWHHVRYRDLGSTRRRGGNEFQELYGRQGKRFNVIDP